MDLGLEILTAIGGSADHPGSGLVSIGALFVVLAPFVGRIFLACLPPGSIGGHAPRELPATAAASFLIGLAWFTAIATLVPGTASTWIALGIPSALLAASIVLRPAGLVPRHDPVPLRAAWMTRAVVVVAVVGVSTLAACVPDFGADVHVALPTLATAVLAHEALALARVQPWIRAVALLAVALGIGLVPYPDDAHERLAALGAAGIAAGLVGWLRRGDRRGLAIAGIGLMYLVDCRSGVSAFALALVVPIAGVLGTARVSRLRAFAWLAGGTIVGFVLSYLTETAADLTYSARTPIGISVEILLAAFVVCVLCAAFVLRIRRESPDWNPSGAPEAREAHVLAIAAFVAVLLLVSVLIASEFGHLESFRNQEIREYTTTSPASASVWVLVIVASAITLARALELRPRTA